MEKKKTIMWTAIGVAAVVAGIAVFAAVKNSGGKGANQGKASVGLQYEYRQNEGYSVIGIGSCTDTEIVIPETYQGEKVISVARECFAGNANITEVVIPDSVTTVGYRAFKNCENLTDVYMGKGVSALQGEVFYDCTALTDVTLKGDVVKMFADNFYNTAFLNDEENWTDGGVYLNRHLIEVQKDVSGTFTVMDGTVGIAATAFDGCESVSKVILPDSVKILSPRAFENASFSSIKLGNAIAEIPENAFKNCDNLRDITLPDSVKKIDAYAFRECRSLTRFVIPDSVESIGTYAFQYCGYLALIVVGDGVKEIKTQAFGECSALTALVLGRGLEYVGESAVCGSTLSLDKVYYKGNKDDWAKIDFDLLNGEILNAKRYYYSATQPTSSGDFWRYEDGYPQAW